MCKTAVRTLRAPREHARGVPRLRVCSPSRCGSLPKSRSPWCDGLSPLHCSCGFHQRAQGRGARGLAIPHESPQNPAIEGSGAKVQPGGLCRPSRGVTKQHPPRQHMDDYSRTKAIADQLTLMANGTPLPGQYRGPCSQQRRLPVPPSPNIRVVLAFS